MLSATLRVLRTLTLLSLGSVLAGCAVERPPSVMCTNIGEMAPSSFLSTSARLISADEIAAEMAADAIAQALEQTRRGPVTLNVLTLSSGGQYGAFGAGFLRGWGENATTPRPDFELVTGVSAGASVAAVPFAGRQFDPMLDVSRGVGEGDVFTRRSVLTVPFGPSVATAAPLKALLERQLTDDLIDQVARRHREDGARLLISAVNIDTTENRVFDLGAIANTPAPLELRRACMIEAMLASGAVPALLPPRHIDGALYVDGGLRDHVFFQTLESERAAAARRTGRDIRVDATMIVNGSLEPFDIRAPDSLIGYLGRSVEILADEVLRDSISEALAFVDDRPGWTLKGIVADIDVGVCGAEVSGGAVNSCITALLFDHGRDVASSGAIKWLSAEALRAKANEL